MNIVVITANNTFVNYMIDKVDRAVSVAKVVRVTPTRKRVGLRRKFEKLFQGKLLQYLEQRLYYEPHLTREDRKVTKRLAQSGVPKDLPEELAVLESELNSEETAAKIRALEPDVLLVCSAPLLKVQIFTIPKIATLNVHFGIAPAYRGANTVFWPLYYRDYENIGVTIHRVTAGIDTGPILVQGTASVDPSDSVVSLFEKLILLATDLTIELLSSADRHALEGTLQTEKGRHFPHRARRIWHDAWLFARFLLRLDRLPHLKGRRLLDAVGTSPGELVSK